MKQAANIYKRFTASVTNGILATSACCAILAAPACLAAAPTLTTPTIVPAVASAHVTLQSDLDGSGYLAVLPGSGSCGTGAQVKAGKDSKDAAAVRAGSIWLFAGKSAIYQVSGLSGKTAYKLCFTADDGASAQATPVSVDFSTVAPVALSGEWKTVGSTGFTGGNDTAEFVMTMSPDGTPYWAFVDSANDRKATVMRYVGGTWSVVGTAGMSKSSAGYLALAFGVDGSPYLAYSDGAINGKLTVAQYSAGSWSEVGGAGLSGGRVGDISLAVAPDGSLYVSYADDFSTISTKGMVQKYSAGKWDIVGGAALTAKSVGSTSLAIAPDGTPHIAFTDYSAGAKTSVMKFSGGKWILVGAAGFSYGGPPSRSSFNSLVIAPDGTLYVAYTTAEYPYSAYVNKFDGASWSLLGGGGVSKGSGSSTRLVAGPDGTLFLAYQDGDDSWKVKVAQFVDDKWSLVSGAAVSSGGGYLPSLGFSADGVLFVGYEDMADSKKTTLKKIGSVAPKLFSSTPAVGAKDVAAGSAIVLNFSDAVSGGSGHVTIANDTDQTSERIDVAADGGKFAWSNGNATLTITPGTALMAGKKYHLEIAATAFTNTDGVAYAGIADATTLSFTTAAGKRPHVETITVNGAGGIPTLGSVPTPGQPAPALSGIPSKPGQTVVMTVTPSSDDENATGQIYVSAYFGNATYFIGSDNKLVKWDQVSQLTPYKTGVLSGTTTVNLGTLDLTGISGWLGIGYGVGSGTAADADVLTNQKYSVWAFQ